MANSGKERDRNASGAAKRAVRNFVLLFAALIAGFQLLFTTVIVHTGLFHVYLELNARICALLLRALGTDARAYRAGINTPQFALEIGVGCDAIQSIGILAAAILAFPAALRAKLVGLLVGASIQAALNLLRILALYYAGVHLPDAFTTLHHTVLPTLFILLGLLTWIGWVQWVGRSTR